MPCVEATARINKNEAKAHCFRYILVFYCDLNRCGMFISYSVRYIRFSSYLCGEKCLISWIQYGWVIHLFVTLFLLLPPPPPPRPPSFSVALSPSFSPVLFFALFSANSRHSVLNGNRGFFRLVLNRLAWLLSARSIFAENLYIALYCVCGADVDSIQIKWYSSSSVKVYGVQFHSFSQCQPRLCRL